MRVSRRLGPFFLGAVFVFIFLGALFRFDGPTSGYWDTYITLPALFTINHPAHFLAKDGSQLYPCRLSGRLPQDLVNKDTYGIISKDQRLGVALLFSPWALFLNIFGFRFFFAISVTCIAWFVLRIARQFSARGWVGIFSVLAVTCNSYFLSLDKLNPNIIGMMLVSLLLYLILSGEAPWFIVGLVYGVLCGARETAILLLPAIIYWLFVLSGNKRRDAILFILGAALLLIPVLYWNKFAFGGLFTHPTQFFGLEGFRPAFSHKFLFFKFDFNGMLNYPFYERIVRTPYFAFPVFLLLPLVLINAFGVILSATVILGVVRLFKERKQLFIFLVLWFLPTYMLFSVMENWSALKLTFLLLFLNPLIIFMSLGLERLLIKKGFIKKLFWLAGASLVILMALKGLSRMDFPADPRWYARFPRVLKGGEISYIGDDLRTKKEEPREISAQKNELTRANLLPRINKVRLDIASAVEKIKKETVQRDIAVIDYWKYIYEP